MGEMKSAYKLFIGKNEGKVALGRSRRKWKDNIRMDLRETRWKVVDWIHLAQDMDQ
jgi:hypothetical protein